MDVYGINNIANHAALSQSFLLGVYRERSIAAETKNLEKDRR